jgi:ATP-dependent protease HslVU (ClpYQ) peptidase subunit
VTIICAKHDPDRKETWIGADTRVTARTFIYPERIEKWIPVGPWRVGTAGSGRFNHIVRRDADRLSEHATPVSLCDALRKLVQDDGWKANPDEAGSLYYPNVSIILASPGGAWILSGGFSITDQAPSDRFLAAGNGDEFAFGAAYALRGCPANVIVRAAVEAAIEYDSACGGDIIVECLK